MSSDSVPLNNRGFAYGDGFFETMLFRQGKCSLLKYHMARMCNTAQRLGMPLTVSEVQRLMRALSDAVIDNKQDQVIKVIFTREAGGRGYRSLELADTEVFVQNFPYASALNEDVLSQGVQLRVCDIRLSIQPVLAGLKHLNRLENVLARNEWRSDAYYEGLLLDQNGLVVEATQSNVFFKIGDRWLTPELNQSGVAGVMRAWLLDSASLLNENFHVTTISLDDLAKASACFICNSVQGIVPVQSIEKKDQRFSFDLGASIQLLHQINNVLL
ncbi:aminodeoxychorismate lyase [Litoribrevibacter euphylliae]|uniref:Aminodeoxychorismate lyase n=1 Tax=Litoribrevibacter euphylliae TaxID=1834034 RepID=A0ABV7HFU9_9GAMM